jgi:hypothetical protein
MRLTRIAVLPVVPLATPTAPPSSIPIDYPWSSSHRCLGRRSGMSLSIPLSSRAHKCRQALWLSQAYRLEMLGQASYLPVWIVGMGFLAANSWVLCQVIGAYTGKDVEKKVE